MDGDGTEYASWGTKALAEPSEAGKDSLEHLGDSEEQMPGGHLVRSKIPSDDRAPVLTHRASVLKNLVQRKLTVDVNNVGDKPPPKSEGGGSRVHRSRSVAHQAMMRGPATSVDEAPRNRIDDAPAPGRSLRARSEQVSHPLPQTSGGAVEMLAMEKLKNKRHGSIVNAKSSTRRSTLDTATSSNSGGQVYDVWGRVIKTARPPTKATTAFVPAELTKNVGGLDVDPRLAISRRSDSVFNFFDSQYAFEVKDGSIFSVEMDDLELFPALSPFIQYKVRVETFPTVGLTRVLAIRKWKRLEITVGECAERLKACGYPGNRMFKVKGVKLEHDTVLTEDMLDNIVADEEVMEVICRYLLDGYYMTDTSLVACAALLIATECKFKKYKAAVVEHIQEVSRTICSNMCLLGSPTALANAGVNTSLFHYPSLHELSSEKGLGLLRMLFARVGMYLDKSANTHFQAALVLQEMDRRLNENCESVPDMTRFVKSNELQRGYNYLRENKLIEEMATMAPRLLGLPMVEEKLFHFVGNRKVEWQVFDHRSWTDLQDFLKKAIRKKKRGLKPLVMLPAVTLDKPHKTRLGDLSGTDLHHVQTLTNMRCRQMHQAMRDLNSWRKQPIEMKFSLEDVQKMTPTERLQYDTVVFLCAQYVTFRHITSLLEMFPPNQITRVVLAGDSFETQVGVAANAVPFNALCVYGRDNKLPVTVHLGDDFKNVAPIGVPMFTQSKVFEAPEGIGRTYADVSYAQITDWTPGFDARRPTVARTQANIVQIIDFFASQAAVQRWHIVTVSPDTDETCVQWAKSMRSDALRRRRINPGVLVWSLSKQKVMYVTLVHGASLEENPSASPDSKDTVRVVDPAYGFTVESENWPENDLLPLPVMPMSWLPFLSYRPKIVIIHLDDASTTPVTTRELYHAMTMPCLESLVLHGPAHRWLMGLSVCSITFNLGFKALVDREGENLMSLRGVESMMASSGLNTPAASRPGSRAGSRPGSPSHRRGSHETPSRRGSIDMRGGSEGRVGKRRGSVHDDEYDEDELLDAPTMIVDQLTAKTKSAGPAMMESRRTSISPIPGQKGSRRTSMSPTPGQFNKSRVHSLDGSDGEVHLPNIHAGRSMSEGLDPPVGGNTLKAQLNQARARAQSTVVKGAMKDGAKSSNKARHSVAF